MAALETSSDIAFSAPQALHRRRVGSHPWIAATWTGSTASRRPCRAIHEGLGCGTRLTLDHTTNAAEIWARHSTSEKLCSLRSQTS